MSRVSPPSASIGPSKRSGIWHLGLHQRRGDLPTGVQHGETTGAVAAQQGIDDCQPDDSVGSLSDPQQPLVAPGPRHRELLRVAVAAVIGSPRPRKTVCLRADHLYDGALDRQLFRRSVVARGRIVRLRHDPLEDRVEFVRQPVDH